jgi:RNA polymerase sigma-70 factor (ECF subfamily)
MCLSYKSKNKSEPIQNLFVNRVESVMIHKDKIVDSLLVLECQSGNNKATSIIVKRWHKKLCKHSYWYTKDLETSRDIVQDSWSVIINKINYLKDPNSFGSWALSIVTRKTIDWLRKHKREIKNQEQYYDTYTPITNDLDNTENALVLIKRSIKTLPEHQQVILHLFYLEEFSIKQISDILSLPIGTVKSRIFTAREKLKSIIKNKYHEE